MIEVIWLFRGFNSY